jgi:hypothetical protein
MTDSAEPSRVQIAPGAWAGGVELPEFKMLIDAKRRSIVPMIIIYVVGYMGLSGLAGFARGLLGIKVLGPVNLGFALSGSKPASDRTTPRSRQSDRQRTCRFSETGTRDHDDQGAGV